MDAAKVSARAPDSASTTMGRRSSVATIAATRAFAVSVNPAMRSRAVPWPSAAIADSNAGCRLTDARVSETDDRIMICCGCRAMRQRRLRRHRGFAARAALWNIPGQVEWKRRVRRQLRLLGVLRFD